MHSCARKFSFTIATALLVSWLFVLTRRTQTRDDAPSQCLVVQRPSLCRTSSVFLCSHCIPDPLPLLVGKNNTSVPNEHWTFDPVRDSRNYVLTDAQCDVAFPGLFEEIKSFAKAREERMITQREVTHMILPEAALSVMIYDNELYVVNNPDPRLHEQRAQATLHALYRAILTSPSPLPNVEFPLSAHDYVEDPAKQILSYTRTADDKNTLIMPDFGFWSYGQPEPHIALGSWQQVRERMRLVEANYSSFSDKIPKAFWRGDAVMADEIRGELIKNTENQQWADVRNLDFRESNSPGLGHTARPIHESCRYMFLIHTEGERSSQPRVPNRPHTDSLPRTGVSYSGRLKYLQNCRSVIFAHVFEWIQPLQYLMVSSGPKQNYVQVSRDFSDLQRKIEYYLEHPDEAERIANSSVATFRDRYNTPAAETCYWRKLIRGWASVSEEPELYERENESGEMVWRGTPFETYAVRRKLDSASD